MKPVPLAFACLMLLSKPVGAVDLNGTAEIVDGDTLEIEGSTIRLFGIDAPETGQLCGRAGQKLFRPSEDAISRLQSLSRGRVRCQGTEYDDYGRLIATCFSQAGIEINRSLVKEGLAWAFVKYSDAYAKEEMDAQALRLGIWQMGCEPPWIFREKRWRVAEQKAPNGCPIKGNISGNGKIYHTPWSRYYAQTGVNTKRGERWFCNEKEATDAGWRLPVR